MIKVLVVEDSKVVRDFLVQILLSDPGIHVIGSAKNGEEAVELTAHLKPDVITMDIHMPKMNGFEATRKIMETRPTPIIIISGSSSREETLTTFRAIEAGALTVLARPNGQGHPNYETSAKELINTIKLMSEVKVVRRWNHGSSKRTSEPAGGAAEPQVKRSAVPIEIIAIGASTGGPLILQTIFSNLPQNFPVPILLVQHMSAGFIGGFVDWLDKTTGQNVSIAQQGEELQPAHIYTAPDDFHIKVTSQHKIILTKEEPENGMRPAVSVLFRSVNEIYRSKSAAVLLTGMGKDGAQELKQLRDCGAVTMAQDQNSSVVFGMPGEAVKLDAAVYVLPPEQIASALQSLVIGR
jgi:two-component system chemotaxis response regulator CheB